MIQITCNCGHTFEDAFAELFQGEANCPKCHPYIPGTAKGESDEELAEMEMSQSKIHPTKTGNDDH